ncbi:MAG: M56 family metallopeptidase, partial [Planctomycetes bacterium]|nr:M56 family metallopeptidase [Planctomycetota bacterium]
MVPIAQWVTRPWTQDLIMTLGHSLWQGLMLSALLYGLLNSKRGTQPQTRYLAGTGALLALLLCLFATFALLQLERPEPTPVNTPAPSLHTDASRNVNGARALRVQPHVRIQTSVAVPWQTWALGAWITGTGVMLIRMVSLLLGVHALTRQSVPVKDPAILDLIDSVRTKLCLRRHVLVVTGDHIMSPGVIGFLKPILLLPMSLVTGVPSDDLEAILLHELTHIRRYDYAINFFQMVIEALLFFNPAVRWINRQIRLEREACCDDAAVAFSGQRLRYAELLMQWSSQAGHQPNQVAAMASFSTHKNASLAERIKRIALPHHTPRIH